MLPCSHAVHSLSSHSRSLVDVSSTDSYCAAVHVVCDAQVPHPLCASVGATFMYSVPEHTFTAEHSRLTDADGTRVSHVTPIVHTRHDSQLVRRWLNKAWYVCGGQSLHVRLAVAVSADMSSPAPHVGCAMHSVARCCALGWYVLLGQSLHVRCALVVSGDATWPAPHTGCEVQATSRWLVCDWNVLGGHPLQ